MTQMTELVEKGTEICMIMIFSTLPKLQGRLDMLGRDKEDHEKTLTETRKWGEKNTGWNSQQIRHWRKKEGLMNLKIQQ